MNTLKQLIERLVLDSPDPSLLDGHLPRMTKNTNPTAFSNLAYPLHQNPIHGHREGSNYALSMVRTFKVRPV